MTKCDICSNKIVELFLKKLRGTVVKKAGSSKKYFICSDCQKSKSKEELLSSIK